MPIPKKLLSYLTGKSLNHDVVRHKKVYTAFDAAKTLRAPLTAIAKALLLKSEKGFFLAVLSAGHILDIKKITKLAKVKKVRIPSEKELWQFLKKKHAALTPFGGHYGISVFLDKNFLKNKQGIFSAGSFTESLRMPLKHFLAAEQPITGIFGSIRKKKAQKNKKKKK
jgi:Ala-tRNA(Pro) deacylase